MTELESQQNNHEQTKQAEEYAIQIKDLVKIYTGKGNKKVALNGINLNITKGSFFGLLGPNGAGKSTIINILAGLTLKTSGEAKIYNYNIDEDLDKAKRSIGVVPQEIAYDNFFTVREALENQAGFYGVPKSARKTDEIIHALGLSDKANIYPRSLSGGMKRRLLIAKALVHSPKVLILDEPTAGVDIELREQLWSYIHKIHQNGTTIILTTHYLEEAEKLCTDIGIINNGEVVVCDKALNLLNKLDHKELHISFGMPISSIPVELNDLEVEILPKGSISIKYRSSNINLQEILDKVKQTKLTLQSITSKDADLEHVFKHIVRGSSH